jgi:hypothetical protein
MKRARLIARLIQLATLSLCASAAAASPSEPDRLIVTGIEDRALTLPGGVQILVGAGAKIVRMPPTELMLASNAGKTTTEVVVLESGSLDVHIGVGRKPYAVMVRSAGKTLAVVKTGRARVLAKAGGLVVANLDGETLVGTQQGIRSLPAGTIRDVSGAAGSNRQLPFLSAPSWEVGPRVALWLGEQLRPAELRWTAVPNAAHYAIELLDSAGGVVRRIRATTTSASLGEPSLSGGPREARVRAVDEYGIDGAPSATTRLVVASALLPEGSRIDESGNVMLAPGQTIRFSQASLLEVSRGDRFHWVPATGDFGLDHGRAQKLFVRSAGSFSGIPLQVAPRDIIAEVTIGPATAYWPSDPVQIRVQVKDSHGTTPAWVKPVVKVTVGLTPVAVGWERSGSELRATLLPHPGSGPTVVRVEVLDQFGISIGRGFLEVERPRVASR